MSKLVASDNGNVRGKCSVCGTTEVRRQKRNPKYFKPFYFSVHERVDWFRGNDEYVGRICKDCLEAGRISETHKQLPPKATEVSK